MAQQQDLNGADDFLDRDTLLGRVRWIAHALSRLIVAGVVGLVFFTGLAVIELRHEAESALSQGRPNQPQPALHELLTNQRLQGIAGLSADGPRAQAEAVYIAEEDLAEALNAQTSAAARVEEATRQLISAAEIANCGVAPAVAAAMACAGSGDASLVGGLEEAKAGYRAATEANVAAQICSRAAQVRLDRARKGEILSPTAPVAASADAPAAASTPQAPQCIFHGQSLASATVMPVAGQAASTEGVPLAPAVPALREFDNLQRLMPAPVRPVVSGFFGMDSEASTLVMAFIAGLLGAICLLFILIAFPGYMPLTFGSGRHFFLRMFTGGAVAFLVVLVLRLMAQTGGGGVTGGPAELAQAQALLATSGFSEPVRYALIGVVAGFFAEQIAKWAKDHSETVFSGFRSGSAATAATPSATQPQTYNTPPEGGPRPQVD